MEKKDKSTEDSLEERRRVLASVELPLPPPRLFFSDDELRLRYEQNHARFRRGVGAPTS